MKPGHLLWDDLASPAMDHGAGSLSSSAAKGQISPELWAVIWRRMIEVSLNSSDLTINLLVTIES